MANSVHIWSPPKRRGRGSTASHRVARRRLRILRLSPAEPQSAEHQVYDGAEYDVVREVPQEECRRRHLEAVARYRLADDRAQHIQRRKVSARCAVNNHQADHPAVDVIPSRKSQRERRQQRHTCRSQRARHCRQCRDDEDDPGNQRPPVFDQARRPLYDAPNRAVVFRDCEQVGDTGEQHQQFDGESAVHLLYALAHEDRADEERHHQ